MSTWGWQRHWQTIVRKIRVVGDAGDEQALIEGLSMPQKATVVGFVNAHAMNLVTGNDDYYQALSAADVLLRDGSGMSILFRRMGREPGLNMNGTDFIPKLLSAYKGRRVALWGTQEPYLADDFSNALRHGAINRIWFRWVISHPVEQKDSTIASDRLLLNATTKRHWSYRPRMNWARLWRSLTTPPSKFLRRQQPVNQLL